MAATRKPTFSDVLARAKEARQQMAQGDLTAKLKAMQPVSRTEYNALVTRLETLEARVQQLQRTQVR
jgi:polyhydroxyalkanoate synthesis regulator phasin